MKKMTTFLVVVVLMLSFAPFQLKASEVATPITMISDKSAETKAKVLLTRLDEINAMEKSALGFAEKKALRKEVRAIRGELKELGDKVYISVGAIIIILLLLIILL